MAEIDDFELLAEYAGKGSETAFTALVERHVRVVYSAALRQVHDPHLAEEVTQVVFVLLARKAHAFRRGIILSAWLLRATRFTSTNLLVSQYRRIRREHEAAQMQNTSPDDASWQYIAPLLDEAMSRLSEKDRNVLALRFFEQKSLEEVAASLGIDTGTAQKRVWRAVDKLRQYFARHGAAFSAAAITTSLSAHAVHGVPSGFSATMAATTALKGSAAASSTTTLINSTLKLMAWTKAKTALVAGVIVLLAAGTATVTVTRIHKPQNYPWQMAGFDGGVLAAAPPQLAILPSKVTYGASGNMGGKLMGTGVSAQSVVEAAYSDQGGWLKTTVVADLPKGEFDYIASLAGGNAARLREEVKRQFGVTARIETRKTNVLALTVKNANAPSLKPGTGHGSSGRSSRGEYTAVNQSLSSLIYFLAFYVKTPVVDHTGVNGQFDFHLKWDAIDVQHPNLEGLKEALLDQLGLELVPATEPIRVLVIEKAK